MSMEIYQEIWDADQACNGVPALRDDETASEQKGYVIVNEPEESVSSDHKVLAKVKIPDSKMETYRLCQRLFNNYTLDPAVRELVTEEETREERDFVDAIVQLPPLQVAKDYISRQLDQSVSDMTLASMIKETWFFQGHAGSKHASGFEHVFVGEQKVKGEQPDEKPVTMGGYHFWYKYYLDDAGYQIPIDSNGGDRIVFHGTRYGGADTPEKGILVPEIVTLSFEWIAPDFDSGGQQHLTKPIGGFWVGCSPEALIALGLVRCRTKAGKIAKINGATYQLDLHRLDDNSGSIRTFFPRFKSYDYKEIESRPSNGEPPDHVSTANEIRIVAALVNPSENEAGRESVTLLNTSPASISLSNWVIQAPNGFRFVFSDIVLKGGEVRTFRIPSNDPQFRNKEGKITLLDDKGQTHHQVRYTTEEAKREGYTIVF